MENRVIPTKIAMKAKLVVLLQLCDLTCMRVVSYPSYMEIYNNIYYLLYFIYN